MFKLPKAYAHCDIPCKIYDPAAAQYAVLSVIRIIDLLNEIEESPSDKKNIAEVSRLISQKEEHAKIAKKQEFRFETFADCCRKTKRPKSFETHFGNVSRVKKLRKTSKNREKFAKNS